MILGPDHNTFGQKENATKTYRTAQRGIEEQWWQKRRQGHGNVLVDETEAPRSLADGKQDGGHTNHHAPGCWLA